MDFFQNTCVKDCSKMAAKKSSGQRKIFVKAIPVTTWSNKHSSKKVVPIIRTLDKKFFAATFLLKVCESFLFRESKNIVIYFGLHESPLHF